MAVLRAHQLHGFPGVKELRRASRFSAWDKGIRAAIVWTGYADPIITQEAIRSDDPVRAENLRLLWVLREKFIVDVRPLKQHGNIGRALSYEEKTKVLFAADSNPEWQNARWAMTLAFCTTVRGVEIKNLHWRDVDLLGRSFTVRRSKDGCWTALDSNE